MINGKKNSIRTLTNENLIYIGSTKEPRLSARLLKHTSNSISLVAGLSLERDHGGTHRVSKPSPDMRRVHAVFHT